MIKKLLILTLFLCLWFIETQEPDQRLAPGGVIPPGVGAVGTPTIGTPIATIPATTGTIPTIPTIDIIRSMFPSGVPGMELLTPGAIATPTGVARGVPVTPAAEPAIVTPRTIPIPGDFRPREPARETTPSTPPVRFYQDDLGRIYYYDPAGSGRRFYVDEYGNSYYYDQYGRRFFLDPSVASIMDGTYDPGRQPPGAESAPTTTPTPTTTTTVPTTTAPATIPGTTTVPAGYTGIPAITPPTPPAGLSIPTTGFPFGLPTTTSIPVGSIPTTTAIPTTTVAPTSSLPLGATPAGAPVVRTTPIGV